MKGLLGSLFEISYIEARKIGFRGSYEKKRKFLNDYQAYKLSKLLHHSYKKSSFYRRRLTGCGISKKDLPYVSFRDLPILHKKDVIDNFDDMVTNPVLKIKNIKEFIAQQSVQSAQAAHANQAVLLNQKDSHKFYLNNYVCLATSGSMGSPMNVVYSLQDWNRIVINALYYFSGINFFKNKKRFAAISVHEKQSASVNFFRQAPDLLFEKKQISIFNPAEKLVEELNTFNPQQIVSYPGVFLSLLEAQEKGDLKISPQRIALGGEILTDENSQRIRSAFGAKEVLNTYGASECLILCVKRNSEDPIFFPHLAHIEVLNEKNQTVKPGEIGRVVITNLFNYTQPFIRYELSDLATTELNEYGDPVFKLAVGRNHSSLIFKHNNGEQVKVSPLLLESIFYKTDGVANLQITIERDDYLQIDAICNDAAHAQLNKKMSDFLERMGFGNTVKTQVNRVEYIKPDANGKIPLFKKASV